jgi:hypothetical protein
MAKEYDDFQMLYITRPFENEHLWFIKSFNIQQTNSINDTTTFVDDTVEFVLGQQDNTIGVKRVTYNITAWYLADEFWVINTPTIGERLIFRVGMVTDLVYSTIFEDVVVVRSITSSLDVNGAYQIDLVAERDIEFYF